MDRIRPLLQAQINKAGTFVVTNGLVAGDSTAALRFNGVNQGFYGNGGDMNTIIGTTRAASPPARATMLSSATQYTAKDIHRPRHLIM